MSQIIQVPTDKLVPYVNNSRTHSAKQVDQIAASIKEFGFTNPVLTDGENGIIAGHGRVMAAKKLGIKTVPCIELSHLTPTQRKVYIIADNKMALNADWDNELLALELSELKDAGYDMDLIGFSPEEFVSITGQVDEIDLPTLPDGDKEPFQQMAFILHDEQKEQVDRALQIAKSMGEFTGSLNENSNGNALARICEIFVTNYDKR